ncbi:hypothetical protein SCAR479_10592 [Seiridium cardinale]|uniref:Uncharacterized protein n=1 Tax=Seiridium cardinale TaxID=138064 RepID=A0ABR2XG27_9PEZI
MFGGLANLRPKYDTQASSILLIVPVDPLGNKSHFYRQNVRAPLWIDGALTSMSHSLRLMLQPSTIGPPPKDVPPATPVRLPDYAPQCHEHASRHRSLVKHLQSLHRPAGLSEAHFAALGVDVHTDVPAEDVVPVPSFLPPASEEWDAVTPDQVQTKDAKFRIPLSNGNLSPEARAYLDRRSELLTDNETAFRTVRRIRPGPGTKAARLGNCYEFYRQLEQMAGYWDDTSLPPLPDDGQAVPKEAEAKPPKSSLAKPLDSSLEQAQLVLVGSATAPESNSRSEPKDREHKESWRVTYRTASGNTMPAEIRHNMVSSFIKLVAYDFGCNLCAPRVEPRLQLLEPPSSHKHQSREPLASYYPSGCVFLVRTPTTRDAARSGIVEGPLAAVSARNTISFSTQTENSIDFGRELIAALITAQHRARDGKEEKRFGEGKWWATAKRWGGGEGGPIGREIESSAGGGVGDKEKSPIDPPVNTTTSPTSSAALNAEKPSPPQNGGRSTSSRTPSGRLQSPPYPISPSSGLPMRGPPAAKRQRKGGQLSIYENYRQVRLPSSTWDKKARYMALGKVPGAEYDDVFVISSVFHHLSVLRVRVPMRLLDVLAGAPEDADDDNKDRKEEAKGAERSWGKLEVWRSKWFDMFLAQDRVEALRLLWGINAWTMRKVEGKDDKKDVDMKGA